MVLEIGRDEALIKLAGGRRKLILLQFLFNAPMAWLKQSFSLRRLMPQVPPCDSWAQMDLNHHLHCWQHFASICCGVGRQCGTLSWPCGVGHGERAVQGFAVSLLCMALGGCWQLTEAHIDQTLEGNNGEAQNIPNLEVNEEHRWQLQQ